jgi:hypothetical protein
MLRRAWRKHIADGDAKAGSASGGGVLSGAHVAGADGLSSWSPSFGARSPDASAGYGACSCLRRANADGGDASEFGFDADRSGGYATRVAAGHFTVAGAGWPRGEDSDEEGGGGEAAGGGGGRMRSLAACSPVAACCTPPTERAD